MRRTMLLAGGAVYAGLAAWLLMTRPSTGTTVVAVVAVTVFLCAVAFFLAGLQETSRWSERQDRDR